MATTEKRVAAYYKDMYLSLFNDVTDAIGEIEEAEENEKVERAREILIRAQQDCEEIYISAGEDNNEGEAEEKTE